jgi:thiol-disulfide isomerase/thioredoxin|tara:strand:- start:4085 stop:4570 length:486 start_codon:yes stop_codon:yes gene_type:complete
LRKIIRYISFLTLIIFLSCENKKEVNKIKKLKPLTTLKNEEFKLEELKGNVVIVNLWATWCKPCIAEFKSLEKSKEIFKEKNIKIIAISNESLEKISNFLSKRTIDLDFIKLNGDLSYFNAYSLPTTIVLNKDGNESFRITNSINFTSNDFTKKILNLEAL